MYPAQPHAGNPATPITASRRSGVYHWVGRRNGLEVTYEKTLKLGLASSGAIDAARHTPDGGLLKWKLLFPDNHGFGALVPFFID